MKSENSKNGSACIAHIVVDMLYDFIDGSLACHNAENAVKASVEYINAHPDQLVVYIADSHPANHSSFSEYGGIWPSHCVSGSRGGAIHESFYMKIRRYEAVPQESNIFRKGEDLEKEQYSGYEAKLPSSETIEQFLRIKGVKNIVVSGIATEFCINETVRDLLSAGFNIGVLKQALAYVDYQEHLKILESFKAEGVKIVF